MINVWKVTDYAGHLFHHLAHNSEKMPSALPWIEPSINCLHMESVNSFLVGNYECSIMAMCALLEHTLRLAVINKDECGLVRPESVQQIDKYNSLVNIIDEAVQNPVFNGCDENWWRAITKNIRNKSAHYLLPIILRNCASDPILKDYISEYDLPEKNERSYFDRYITESGAFDHSSGGYLAEKFINDSTEQLRIIISNTNWNGDTSWWISEKEQYESFFNYKWSTENIKESFAMAYSSFGGTR